MNVQESCRIARAAYSRKARDPINLLRRFWSKVNITGIDDCWIWTGSKTPLGYGGINIGGRWHSAHRKSFEFSYGHLPLNLDVLHRCDNPPCCNPKHLFLGTAKDNMMDAAKKSRMGKTRGEDHPKTTITLSQVAELRKLYASGQFTQEQLACKFHVCRATIHNIVSFKTWKYSN